MIAGYEELKENISSIELTFHEYAKGHSTLDTDNGNHEFIPSKFILFDDTLNKTRGQYFGEREHNKRRCDTERNNITQTI